MRANLLLLIAFFFSFNIKAQPVERNLLQKHPSRNTICLINRADWKPFSKIPEAWRKVLSKKEIDRFISLGDSALKKRFYSLSAISIKLQGNSE
nr:hypothetical protein [uncultured Pedobacter sp.]